MALHLMTYGQTFSMMGRLAIPNLPLQFRQARHLVLLLGVQQALWRRAQSACAQ